MNIELIPKPARLSKSNSNWLRCREQFLRLKDEECLKITGLNAAEMLPLRQQAYREEKARSFVRIEDGKPALYLYKRS